MLTDEDVERITCSKIARMVRNNTHSLRQRNNNRHDGGDIMLPLTNMPPQHDSVGTEAPVEENDDGQAVRPQWYHRLRSEGQQHYLRRRRTTERKRVRFLS